MAAKMGQDIVLKTQNTAKPILQIMQYRNDLLKKFYEKFGAAGKKSSFL